MDPSKESTPGLKEDLFCYFCRAIAFLQAEISSSNDGIPFLEARSHVQANFCLGAVDESILGFKLPCKPICIEILHSVWRGNSKEIKGNNV